MLGGRTDGILSVANLIYKPNLRLQKIRPNIQNIVLTLSGNLSGGKGKNNNVVWGLEKKCRQPEQTDIQKWFGDHEG